MQRQNRQLSREIDRLRGNSEGVVTSRINQIKAEYNLEIAELQEKIATLESQMAIMKKRMKDAGIEDKKPISVSCRKITSI